MKQSRQPVAPGRLVSLSEEGLQKVQQRIEELRADLAAASILLFDSSGQLLTSSGRHGNFDLAAFLVLVSNAMAASNEVIHMLQDETSFDLHFHEGKTFDVYTARITDQVFLTLLFAHHSTMSRVGLVWLSLRRAITDLRSVLATCMTQSRAAKESELISAFSANLDEALDQLGGPSPSPEERPRSLRRDMPPDLPKVRQDSLPPPTFHPPASDDSLISYDQARAMGLLNPVDRPKDDDQARAMGLLDPDDTLLSYDQARAIGLVNLPDPPKPNDPPKSYDPPIPFDSPKSFDPPQSFELPKDDRQEKPSDSSWRSRYRKKQKE